MSGVKIVMPVGAFGASDYDSVLDKVIREIAAAFCGARKNQNPYPIMGSAEADVAKYGIEFENDVFFMQPDYMDAECECGFGDKYDAASEAWHAENRHAPGCYQTVLASRLAEYDESIGYVERDWSFADAFDADSEPMEIEGEVIGHSTLWTPRAPTEQDRLYDLHRKHEDKLYTELCAEFGLPKYGCAMHCTCEWKAKRQAFNDSMGDHDPRCNFALPNFWYKPTDLRVEWYKYIGRSMKMNRAASFDEIAEVRRRCLASASSGENDRP